MPRRTRVLACLLALAVLAGCSGTQFFYNRLDVLLPWYLSRYVDLERGQRDALKARVDAFLGWHRREELPRYAALLARMESALDGRVAPHVVAGFALDAERAWERSRDRGLEELIALAGELDAAQLAGFIERMEEKQAEYEEEYLSRDDDEYREDACDRLVDTLEDNLGRLGRGREKRLCALLSDLRRSDRAWLAERQRWIDWLATVLEREPGWEQRLVEGVRNWGETLPADRRALYDHNSDLIFRVVAEAVESRSERQDRHLRRRLAGLRADAVSLSAP
jgi:hypothetical protein